ncbi:MAG: pyruvate kinase [Verrucomicrobia bacterium]|nr:pyruvate kinase [Verrucomicrobiota bacterium]
MRTRTKIICTMGPAVGSYEKILELIDAGMNVARLNFSHGTHEEHKKMIDNLKRARAEKKVPLAIMLDTKGPKIRLAVLPQPIPVKKGEELLLTPGGTPQDNRIPVFPGVAIQPLKKGDSVLIDDGYICAQVLENTPQGVRIQILNDGLIKSQKGVNLPYVDVPLPAMTEQDVKDIQFGCEQDIDLIAASFIRSADHVKSIRDLLIKLKKPEIHIIAKIESSLGVQNFDSILHEADGIMVARGDLGVELPIQQVPVLQKMMIRKGVKASKPVVTATQMLESMINNPRPTRAEASDVANAIYDSTSAVMLSGETAVGKYPIETVKIMRSIVDTAESDFHYRDFFHHESRIDCQDISSAISLASVRAAYSLDAQAIFAFTSSGLTACLISRYRPEMPIIALTDNPKTYHQLAFNWGVIPVDPTPSKNAREALAITSAFARKRNLVKSGDRVIVTTGTPFGIKGTTNNMFVETLDGELVRGDE